MKELLPTPPSAATWLERMITPRTVCALAAVLFLWNLWGYELWAPDEPYFAEGAREMLVDGHWLVPHVNGELSTDKPPLFFWLIALFSLPAGGVSALWARLPSALAGLGSLLLTMRLATRLAGPRVAGTAGMVLATSHMFWEKSRMAQIDATLCLFTLLALSAFEAFRARDWPGRRAGALFGAATALGVLAKGPVGLLVPLGVVIATLAADRRLRDLPRFGLGTGSALFAVVVAAWAIPASLLVEGYSVLGALQEHFVERASQGMHHVRPFWYYGRVLLYAPLPWSLALPGALLLAWRRRRVAADRFLLVWPGFVVLFFSISVEKRDLYLLPALPALAILVAQLIAAHSGLWRPTTGQDRVPRRRWLTAPLGAGATLMILIALGAPLVARRELPQLLGSAIGIGAVLLVGASAALWSAARGRAASATVRTGLTMSALLLAVVTFAYPALNSEKSGRELALVVARESEAARAAGDRVLGLDLSNLVRPVNFYADGLYLDLLDDPREVAARLHPNRPTYLLARVERLEELAPEIAARMETLYQTRLSRRDVALVRFEPRER